MAELLIRGPTRLEEEAEDFDPIPCIALACFGRTTTDFQMALPDGLGRFSTTFSGSFPPDPGMYVNQAAVRYSQHVAPTFMAFKCGGTALHEGDVITVHVTPGSR